MSNQKELLSLFTENRLLILRAIYHCSGDVCNCDLVEKLDLPKNLVSYHIKYLLSMKVIEEAKCGRSKKYSISKNYFNKVENILKILELI